jgi:hypothetical protein
MASPTQTSFAHVCPHHGILSQGDPYHALARRPARWSSPRSYFLAEPPPRAPWPGTAAKPITRPPRRLHHESPLKCAPPGTKSDSAEVLNVSFGCRLIGDRSLTARHGSSCGTDRRWRHLRHPRHMQALRVKPHCFASSCIRHAVTDLKTVRIGRPHFASSRRDDWPFASSILCRSMVGNIPQSAMRHRIEQPSLHWHEVR